MTNKCRVLKIVLAVVLLVALIVTPPVYAYLYSAGIAIINGGASSYSMLPVIIANNNSYMADNGFMATSGNDTRVQDASGNNKPSMITDNKTLTALAVTPQSQTNLYMTTGNDAWTTQSIITGYGGYVTAGDDADLEWGNSGNVTVRGCFDPTATGYLFNKPNAISAQGNGDGTITAIVGSTTQVISGGNADPLSAAATEYNCLMGAGYWNATENNIYQVMPTAGTISNMYIRLSAAVGGGATYTITLMKNGAPQALTVTISAGVSTGNDLTHSVAYVAGDTISIRSTYTGAPGTPFAQWSTLFTPTISGESIFLCSGTISSGGIVHNIPQGSGHGSGTQFGVPMPTSGTFKKLFVQLSTDPGAAPDDYKFTLSVNGSNTALTTTIAADNTAGNDTTHTVAISSGDLVSFRSTPENTPSASPIAAMSMVFISSTLGESIVCGGWAPMSASVTNYTLAQGDISSGVINIWDATESNRYQLTQHCTVSKLYVITDTAPQNGAGTQSYTVSIREAAGNTGITVTISETALTGNDVVHSYSSVNGAVANMMSVPSGTPAQWDYRWAYVRTSDYAAVTTAAITSGEHTIQTYLSGGTFGVKVDVGAAVTTTFAASVPDNNNSWVFCTGNIMSYMESVSLSVGGTRQLYYAPNTMILGDALPDRDAAGGDNGGTITWGTNLADITATIDSLIPGAQPAPGATSTQPAPDVLPYNAGGTNWFADPDIAELQANPFYIVIKYTSETGGLSTFTEIQVWRFFGIWFVLILTAAAVIVVRGHLLVASVVCCASIWFMVHLTIFPMVILIALVPALLVGLVMERSPSV